MANEVIMNGGESPLASKVAASGQAAPEASQGVQTSWQGSSGASPMDGGHAPTGVGKAQEHVSTASTDESGVAPTGGMVHSK